MKPAESVQPRGTFQGLEFMHRVFPMLGKLTAFTFQPSFARRAASVCQPFERILMPHAILGLVLLAGAARGGERVDFSFAPPEWQMAICLPDDPQKSLVDKSGALLYHFGKGGHEFATRVGVEVASNAVWQKQELFSPRVPLVKTFRTAGDLQIVEEAFAVTDLKQPKTSAPLLCRLDAGGKNKNWAHPSGVVAAELKDIAVHMHGALQFEVSGSSCRVALALCEGWWGEPGKRVLQLNVEGAALQTVDTVADIGKNKAAAFWFDAKDTNGDGKIEIAVEPDSKAGDKSAILNGLWLFPAGTKADDAALLAGKLSATALAQLNSAVPSGPSRNDLVLVHVTNTGKEPRTIQPKLRLHAALGFRRADQRIIVNDHETITSSLKLLADESAAKSQHAVQLEALTLKPGGTADFFVLYSSGGTLVIEPTTLRQARAARERAIRYWENAPLPYGRISVPDAGIQALVDSSIRNIWQAREIKKGLTAFQVGPTCYRGLWIVDGAFLLEAATILGAGEQARNGVAYELTHQKEDGRIEVLKEFYKENGIVLWTCARHAQLTQDKAWLESVWPKLEAAAGYIKVLRQRSRENATPLDDGLNPPGEIDGGLSGARTGFKQPEFSNAHWNLLGLRAFVEAARWLGKTNEAAAWQKEYDDFAATFRAAAARDTLKDDRGNAYVPIYMANAGAELPQRAQWTFCHAVYPGQLFAKDDPLVASTLAMLAATEREGMVYGTGWDATGIWNYFASFYAHAWLWQGDGRKAAQALYAYANHAAPVLDWREEQSLRGEKFKKVGDMPHNWASAEFIRLTTHLLALDRGNELHLFEGLPAAWTQAGMVTKLNGICTPFGKLTLEPKIAKDGKTAALRVEPLSDASCQKIVVHLSGWASTAPNATLALDPRQRNRQDIKLKPAPVNP